MPDVTIHVGQTDMYARLSGFTSVPWTCVRRKSTEYSTFSLTVRTVASLPVTPLKRLHPHPSTLSTCPRLVMRMIIQLIHLELCGEMRQVQPLRRLSKQDFQATNSSWLC
jgi:hypothetical protein